MKTKDAVISEILTTNYAMFYRIAFSYVRNEADALDTGSSNEIFAP